MPEIAKTFQLYDEIKKGRFDLADEFFDSLWVIFTWLAHQEEAKSLLDEMEAWAVTHANDHPEFLAKIYLSLGAIEFLSDSFDAANKHLEQANEIFAELNDEDGIAASNSIIGFIHRSTGEIDHALKFGLPAIEQLAKSGKYRMFTIIGSYWVGGVYAETGHLDEALRLFKQGLNVDFPAGIKAMDARLTNGIAGVYMKQHNYTLALENYQNALKLCDNSNTERTFKARGLTDLGEYYNKMNDYDQAIHYNLEALKLRQEMNVLNGSITNLMNLGAIYQKQGKFTEAINVLNRGLRLAEEIKVKVKMYQIHHSLSDIYLGMGNLLESLGHYRAFYEIKEDVNHEDLERKVKNQVQLFQAQQTQKENAIIKAQKIEIESKNIELQEIIEELTLAKISKKARALTLGIGIILFVFQDIIIEHILEIFASDNFWLSISIKVAIIFSLNPINKAIEHYMVKKVIKRKKKEVEYGLRIL